MPIFIDRKELNHHLITVYKEDGVKSLGEMLRDILTLHNNEYSDVGSYLLLNWANTKKGLEFRDVDFVSNFRVVFEEPMVVQPVVNYAQGDYEVPTLHCQTILDFEIIIVQKIFSNALVTRTKEGNYIRKYFDEISSEYCSDTTYQNVLRYRKAFYDFIYKSRHEAITARMWFNILWSEICENIKQNKQFIIRELLDILFSLNHHFDSTNSNFGGHSMPSLIPQLRDNVRAVIHSQGAKHLESDEEFCYAAGQLMYMLVYANSSGNKSHALIEPYISKTQIKQFKLALANGIQRYSHAFEIMANGKGRTESLAAEVLGYDSEIDLKELLPITLAGYFSQSLVFEKTE